MGRIIGRNTKIGLAKEATRGTGVPAAFWIPVLDLGFDDNFDLKDNESGFGNIAAISDSQIVKRWGEGDYAGKIFDRSVGLELTALFGQSPTIVQRGTSGVYDHSYSMLNSNSHQSVTATVSEENYTGRFPNGMIDSWALEAEVGDFIRRTVSLVSKPSTSATDTPGYTNEAEFLPKHMSVKLAAVGASDATLDGTASAKIRSINFEVNKNAEASQVFGSNDVDDVNNKQLEVTGEFELYYDNRTYHTLAAAGTHQSMRIEMINTDITIGTGTTANPALRFQFAEIALEWPSKDFDNNDIATVTVPFRAMLNIASASELTARLTNAYIGTLY